MPIYEYKCSCGKEFETIQRMNDDKLEVCNKDVLECEGDGELTRLINKPGLCSVNTYRRNWRY